MKEAMKLEDVMSFVSKHGTGILLRGGISLAVVAGVLALYYAFAPRSESYRADVRITLESRGGDAVYPNGDRFGSHDLISSPVLSRLWHKYGFDAKGVKFEDFSAWFTIVGYDKERAKVDAEFQGKMSKRNITVSELTAVQKEYEAKLATLSTTTFALSLRPDALLDRDTAVRLLQDIPETWFAEYASIKAPTIPAVVSSDAIRAYVVRTQKSGGRALELVDTIRRYLAELRATARRCRSGLMRGRNARLEGVDLGMYESQLAIFSTEILRLKNRLLVNGGEADLGGYVAARLDDMACERLELEEQINAVVQTMELVGDGKRKAESSRQVVAAADQTPVTVQADSGFFSDFSAMIRRDANQELVPKYAQELTDLRKKMADLSSRQLYYDQIEKYMKTNAATPETAGKALAETTAAIEAFTSELLDVGAKIVDFRDRCLETYRTSDQFYVIPATPAYAKAFKLTLPRAALGLLALWFLYNLVALVKLWNKEPMK